MSRFLGCGLLALFLASLFPQGAVAQLGLFDDLRLIGPAPDIVFRSNDNEDDDFRILARLGGTSLDIDGPIVDCIVRIFRDAEAQTMLLNASGVTINKPLTLGAANPSLVFNNGGDNWTFQAGTSQFSIDGPLNANVFQIGENANSQSLFIGEVGVGVGTGLPGNPGIHIFSDDFSTFSEAKLVIENAESMLADREQLRLKNNGPVRMALENTNLETTWSLVATSDDQFQIRKNGPGTANMAIRASGAFAFGFGGQSNFTLFPNGNAFLRGSLSQQSDRNAKKNIHTADAQDLLKKVVDLPISYWTYKTDADNVRHVGPMAQDFKEAFQVGDSEKSISTLDTSGVALAAIKGLHQQLQSKDERLAEMAKKLQAQTERVAELENEMETRLERLESLLMPQGK